MSTASDTIVVSLILSLFVLLAPIALLVVLQVWLCRRGKWLGILLPALSLLLSLLLVLSMGAFTSVGGSHVMDEHGQIVEEHHAEPDRAEPIPGAVGRAASVFLVSNIPTLVFGGIWLHYKGRRDVQEDLKKMKIEDLE